MVYIAVWSEKKNLTITRCSIGNIEINNFGLIFFFFKTHSDTENSNENSERLLSLKFEICILTLRDKKPYADKNNSTVEGLRIGYNSISNSQYVSCKKKKNCVKFMSREHERHLFSIISTTIICEDPR